MLRVKLSPEDLKMLELNIQASMLTQATVTKCHRQGKDKQHESVVDSSEF